MARRASQARRAPGDCPKDAAYIKTAGPGGAWTLSNNKSYPIVFEGGDGDDTVTVVGRDGAGVLVDGGRGNDSLTVEDRWTWLFREVGPGATLVLAAFALMLAALAVIAWRALARPR